MEAIRATHDQEGYAIGTATLTGTSLGTLATALFVSQTNILPGARVWSSRIAWVSGTVGLLTAVLMGLHVLHSSEQNEERNRRVDPEPTQRDETSSHRLSLQSVTSNNTPSRQPGANGEEGSPLVRRDPPRSQDRDSNLFPEPTVSDDAPPGIGLHTCDSDTKEVVEGLTWISKSKVLLSQQITLSAISNFNDRQSEGSLKLINSNNRDDASLSSK